MLTVHVPQPTDNRSTYSPGAGRPRTYISELRVRVTLDQMLFLESECKKLKCKTSEYLRMLITDAMPEKENQNESDCL